MLRTTGFLLKTSAVAATAYSGAIFAATKDETVKQYVEEYLPYSEHALDLVRDPNVFNYDAVFNPAKTSFDSISKTITDKIQQNSSAPAAPAAPAAETTATVKKTIDATIEATKTQLSNKIQQIKINNPNLNPKVLETVDSINNLIKSIDSANFNESLVTKIQGNLTELSSKIDEYQHNFEKDLNQKLTSVLEQRTNVFEQKEIEITSGLLNQFNAEKQRLIDSYNKKLAVEVEISKQQISKAAVNAITAMRIEQINKFNGLVEEKLSTERNNKLKNLDHLSNKIDDLSNLVLKLDSSLTKLALQKQIDVNLSQLSSLIYSTDEPHPLKKPVENLKKINSSISNDLIQLSLDNIPSDAVINGVLTNPQIIARWNLLIPELRSVSLLPPNSGILGHITSSVFSKLLISKKGSPQGSDIESVIARVDDYLVRGQIDAAVEEVSNLKGWCRKLSEDWIKEARSKCEAEFLVELIKAESKIIE